MKKQFVIACVGIVVAAIVGLVGHRIYLNWCIPHEVAKLNSEDWQVRKGATETLAGIGPAAVPALIDALQDESQRARMHAAQALGEIGPSAQQAIPALVVLLDDRADRWPGPLVPIYSAAALWRIDRHPRSIPVLVDGLGHNQHCDVRKHSADSLGTIGPAAQQAIPALVQSLRTPLVIVTSYCPPGKRTRIDLHPSAAALLRIGVGAKDIPAILNVLGQLDRTSKHMFRFLRLIIPDAKQRVVLHVAALKNRDPGGRIWATYSLITAGPEDKNTVPALIEALKDDNTDVRAWAASILIKIGPVANEAIPALTKAENDSEERVRWRAAMALNVIRQGPVPTINTESRLSAKTAWSICLAVVVVGIVFLYGLSLYRRRPRFRMKLGDFVLFLLILVVVVPSFYLWHLATIREFPFPVGSRILELKYGNRSVRNAAMDRLDHSWPLPVSLEVWAFRDSTSRWCAISSLISQERWDKRKVPILIEALRDESDRVREIAARALGCFGPEAKEAVPALTVALQDWSACEAAARALGQIGPDAKSAVPALIELSLTVENEDVRKAAAEALKKIQPPGTAGQAEL